MSEDIRINLRKVFEDRGCVHALIARKAGITEEKLSLILSLKRRLDANELFALCDALRMTPTELRNYKSKGKRNEEKM